MEPTYFVSRYFVEKHMAKQFAEPSDREPDERPEPVRNSRITRARLHISAALYDLAASLDPAMPVPGREPSHQH